MVDSDVSACEYPEGSKDTSVENNFVIGGHGGDSSVIPLEKPPQPVDENIRLGSQAMGHHAGQRKRTSSASVRLPHALRGLLSSRESNVASTASGLDKG